MEESLNLKTLKPGQEEFSTVLRRIAEAIDSAKEKYLTEIAAIQLAEDGDTCAGVIVHKAAWLEGHFFTTFSFHPSMPGSLHIGQDYFVC